MPRDLPTLPVEGETSLSDTDITTLDTARETTRPTAMGDLRLAGTIAAGLVAGTLGLGALAAPLVGWRDWPSGLQQDQTSTVQLAKPEARKAARPAQSRGRAGALPGTPAPAPGGASALAGLGLPVAGGASIGGPSAGGTSTGGTSTGGLGVLEVGGNRGASERPAPTTGTVIGTTNGADIVVGTTNGADVVGGTANGSGSFSPPGFTAPDNVDTDGDRIPDVYETRNNLNPTDPRDAATVTVTGLSNYARFRIRSLIVDGDTNHDGAIDGLDDSDRDGVTNAAEERNASDPSSVDSNADGVPAAMDDADGDGHADALEPASPLTSTPAEPAP